MADPNESGREFRERRLEEFGEDSFSDTLVIEVVSDDPIGELYAVADQAEAGDVGPARLSLDPETLRSLLTARRLELVESIMADPPESIKALADRLDRTYPAVHEDLDLLADFGVVVFVREGRVNRPVVPYDRIEYSGVITRSEAPT